MSETQTLDLSELTYGELELFEQIVGFVPTDEESMGSVPRVTMAIAVVTIIERRTNPDITVDDVRNAPVGTYNLSGEVIVNPDTDETEGKLE